MLRLRLVEALAAPLPPRTARDICLPVVPNLTVDEGAAVNASLLRYLKVGGFPEVQGAEIRDRVQLLKGYVDLMVLRDVLERHGVSNVEALRRLQRHLMANPASPFSVSKFYRYRSDNGCGILARSIQSTPA